MRIEQPLTKEFAKDMEFESYLSLLNTTLYEVEQSLYKDLEEEYPTIHIIGAARSGTTLLTQLISTHLKVGYINNLIAAFWKAPLFGMQLSKRLLGQGYQSSFTSFFGRTTSVYEPHEFTYFWNYHLGYPDLQQKTAEHEKSINWEMLKKVLLNMTYMIERPLLFKSVLLGFHSHRLFEALPKTCYIYIKRNYIDNAISLLKYREKMLGSVNSWVSLKPRQYHWLKDEDIYTQVVGQILFLEYEYLDQLKNIPDTNKLFVKYDQVCNEPEKVLMNVREMIEIQGFSCKDGLSSVIPFATAESSNKADPALISMLEAAYSRLKSRYPYLDSFNIF
ncbi:MAG: sulfotransferase [Ferruginibacter sp.]